MTLTYFPEPNHKDRLRLAVKFATSVVQLRNAPYPKQTFTADDFNIYKQIKIMKLSSSITEHEILSAQTPHHWATLEDKVLLALEFLSMKVLVGVFNLALDE